MRLRLYENHRFVLHAPFYAAYAPMLPSGLAEELLPSPGVGLAERGGAVLLDGAVDVLWAGPMRVMKHHDENPTRRSSASQRSSAAIRSRSSANTPIRISGSATLPKFALPPSARCRHRGYVCRRICGRQVSTRRVSIASPIAAWLKTSMP